MKLAIEPDIFFPDSQVTTGFGWDPYTFPGRPRIHTAIDRAGAGIVRCPLTIDRSQWIDDDAEGCSVFRLFFHGGELRLLHFIRSELDSGALAAGIARAGLGLGAPIGPVGNHGLSAPAKGGTGRHVHIALILEPGQHDADLRERVGSAWASDCMDSYQARYGSAFSAQVKQRGIIWMNAHALARRDPYYGGAVRIYVNPAVYGL